MCLCFHPLPRFTPVGCLLQRDDAFATRWFLCSRGPRSPGENTSRHLLVTYALDEKHTCGQRPQSGCEAGASRPQAVWMSMRVATWTDEPEMPAGEPGQAARGLRSVQLSLGLRDVPTSPWLWVDIFKLSVLSRWSHHRSIRRRCMLRGSLWQALLICHFASDIIHNN